MVRQRQVFADMEAVAVHGIKRNAGVAPQRVTYRRATCPWPQLSETPTAPPKPPSTHPRTFRWRPSTTRGRRLLSQVQLATTSTYLLPLSELFFVDAQNSESVRPPAWLGPRCGPRGTGISSTARQSSPRSLRGGLPRGGELASRGPAQHEPKASNISVEARVGLRGGPRGEEDAAAISVLPLSEGSFTTSGTLQTILV